jgi:hypothetical protein
MSPAGIELANPVGERLQTHFLDRSATGIGILTNIRNTKLYCVGKIEFLLIILQAISMIDIVVSRFNAPNFHTFLPSLQDY